MRACFRSTLSHRDQDGDAYRAEQLPELVVFHQRTSGCVLHLSILRRERDAVRDDQADDDHDLLARLSVTVAHLEAEVGRLESKYVQLQRYIHVERAVLGLVALVMTALVGFAMTKLLGGH